MKFCGESDGIELWNDGDDVLLYFVREDIWFDLEEDPKGSGEDRFFKIGHSDIRSRERVQEKIRLHLNQIKEKKVG